MADARRRTTETLDAPGSDRSTIIDVEPPRKGGAVASPVRGALAVLFPRRLSGSVLSDDGPATRPFPIYGATFVALVLIPAAAVVLYFAFIASNQYVAEMRLVVRVGRVGAAQSGGLSGIVGQLAGGATGGMGLPTGSNSAIATETGTSTENAHIVTSYIHSRAIVDEMLKLIDLRTIFARPEADFYARLGRDASAEDIEEYWRKMVRPSIEPMSGIVTVKVRAFRAEDAVEISRHIETLSEKLVNEISVRARADAVRRATEEVERSQKNLIASVRDMETYRNREGLIDPIETAKEKAKLLAKLLADQLEAENQLFIATRSLSPDSASVRTLRTQAENLRKQAAGVRAEMAGTEAQAANVAGALARYEEVAVQQKMAQTLYAMAENGLERARIAAEAQSVYLTVFVQPGVPEDSIYPRRLEFSVLIAGFLMVVWSIGALIWAAIQDHRLG